MKHLFNTYFLILGKKDAVTFPAGMRHYIPINEAEDLYEPFSDYKHLINLKKQKGFIIFISKESKTALRDFSAICWQE